MQSEVKRVYGELQAWCDKQTSPAYGDLAAAEAVKAIYPRASAVPRKLMHSQHWRLS
jgi:hypothetical protein